MLNDQANAAAHVAAPSARPARTRPQDIDRHVGRRIRERRLLLGLTQQQLAGLVGVTYQQAHKYEAGVNRVSAGRLGTIARALGVEPGHFFDGIHGDATAGLAESQRLLLELARDFVRLGRPQQAALCAFVRSLARADVEAGAGPAGEGEVEEEDAGRLAA